MEYAHIIVTGVNLGALILVSTIVVYGLIRVFG